MKKYLWGIMLCGLMGCQQKETVNTTDAQLDYCAAQVNRALEAMRDSDYSMEPRNILQGDTVWNCRKASAEEWCSGFWPGILWMDYSYLKGKGTEVASESLASLRKAAEGYEATGNEHYKQIALAAADTLSTLFNDKVGTILSWPRHVKDYGGHNTIMDNMINLELLFWASENGGSGQLREMAVRHADTTMKNHFREDGSCYHVAVYDTLTGAFIKGQTHQGSADSSMWSRGQSWAIYGYTTVYRYTLGATLSGFRAKGDRRLSETAT